jgi:Fe-S cluster assembly protein SufD
VEPRAEACLFFRWDGSEEPSFHLTSLQGHVAAGSRLKIFLLHQGLGSHHRISSALELERDASVEVFCAWIGGKWTVARMGADLSEPGSSWRETHLISTAGREHLDLDSQVRLAAKHTYSDIQVKAVADGNSRAIFTGNLLMEPAAAQSEAYLADHVLLLSENARADSIPGLEIKAADVKASHAASVGQVDEEQLFYLESRGLAPAEARGLIIVGFLRSLMDRAPLPFVQEILDPLLEAKVSP